MSEQKINADVNGDGFHVWHGQEMHRYQVTLSYEDRTMSLTFYQGLGIDHDPTAASVLESVLSDWTPADATFEDWASDYGYDTDSRKAEATFRAVQEQSRAWETLIGAQLAHSIQYGELLSLDPEELAERLAGETR